MDFGPNRDVYTLHRGGDSRGYYLKLESEKNKVVCKTTECLLSTQPDTCWVMRVVENKIILCNCHGKVFILTLDAQGRLNTECSLSLSAFDGSHEKPRSDRRQIDVFMCVTNKREVIITTRKGKKLYICPITDEGQMEGIIEVPLEENEVESRVYGLAFDPTHEEGIVVLRSFPGREDSFEEIDIYSKNGILQDFFFLPKEEPCSINCLLSNPKGVVAIVQYKFSRRRMVDELDFLCNDDREDVACYHLVGNVWMSRVADGYPRNYADLDRIFSKTRL